MIDRLGRENINRYPMMENIGSMKFGSETVDEYKFKNNRGHILIGTGSHSIVYARIISEQPQTGEVIHIPRNRTRQELIAIENGYKKAHRIFERQKAIYIANLIQNLKQHELDYNSKDNLARGTFDYQVSIRYQPKTYNKKDIYYSAPYVFGPILHTLMSEGSDFQVGLYGVLFDHLNRFAKCYASHVENAYLETNVIVKRTLKTSNNELPLEIIFTDLF